MNSMIKVTLNDFEVFTLVDTLHLLAPIKSVDIIVEKTVVGDRKTVAVTQVDGVRVTKVDITDYLPLVTKE